MKSFLNFLTEQVTDDYISKDVDKITSWLRDYSKGAGARGYVIGLSGGVDSSAACGLVVKAVGKENVLGVLLPSITAYKDDVGDGKRVAEHFGVKYVIHPIKNTVESIIQEHGGSLREPQYRLALGNIQARIRMTLLRMYAELNGYLVCGTTNKSEDMIGYFTKAGDGGSGVDIEPLAQYYKSEIKAFARYFKLPDDLVNRVPSAGIWAEQTDEGELGFSYDDFEKYWKWRAERSGDCPVTEEVVKRIEKLYKTTEHKRKLPPYFER